MPAKSFEELQEKRLIEFCLNLYNEYLPSSRKAKLELIKYALTECRYYFLINCRYWTPRCVKQSEAASFESRFREMPDDSFRKFARMNHECFNFVLSSISGHPLIQNGLRGPKGHSNYVRLLIFLIILGKTEDHDILNLISSVSRGAVNAILDTVATAIIDCLEARFVRWPSPQEKALIKAEFGAQGFGDAVGCVDGTSFNIEDKPSDQRGNKRHVDRKLKWAIRAIIVCDHQRRVIYKAVGFKGAAHDSPSYYSTHLGKFPSVYFEEGEYLLGDKGFAISPNLMPPFNERQLATGRDSKNRYNVAHTKCRVGVEHTFGIIKSADHEEEAFWQFRPQSC